MNTTLMRPAWILAWLQRSLLAAVLSVVGVLVCSASVQAACTSGACVSAGPRLASVDSKRGALLNALLGRLAGSSLSLTVLDWNAIATTDVRLVRTISALRANVNASSTSAALTGGATLAQIFTAAATAADADGNGALAASLNKLALQLNGLSSPIHLGTLLSSDGVVGTTTINALDLVTGAIQLYNGDNVLTTSPAPVTLLGSDLGLASIASLQLQAQVVEPPVFVCGGVGVTFHTAAIRVKLDIELATVNADVALLTALGLSASVQLTHLGLYVEVASASGAITAINALSNALTVQVTPGIAKLFLGSIPDATFFNRSRALVASDVGFGTLGAVTIGSLTVSLQVKAAAIGTTSAVRTLNFTQAGGYPQTQTATSSTSSATGLLTTLVSNLTLNVTPSLGLSFVLNGLVMSALQTIVQTTLSVTVLPGLLDNLVDPLLGLLGVHIGEVDVNSGGKFSLCAIGGSVYDDVNHNLQLDRTEAGTATTLYAKLIDAEDLSGPALAVATVDTSTGLYSLTGRGSGRYVLVVNTSSATNTTTAAAPSGWIPTEMPALSRNVTLLNVDMPGQNFGLFRGSKLSGTAFKDNGVGGGSANNGVRDGAEVGVVGSPIKATDNAGSVVYDKTLTGDAGAYTLWVPFSAGSTTVKVTQTSSADWISVGGSAGNTGGSYARATDTVTLTHASGSTYTGVNFADVPVNVFDTDGQRTVLPGSVTSFPHSFTAGSAGQLTFVLSGPATAGWSATAYVDLDCDGVLDAGETLIAAAMSVVADQKVCIVAKVFTPVTAPYNTQYLLALTAHMAYANNALTTDHLRNDLTVVGSNLSAGLSLTKLVDKASALPGEVLTYTITYVNQSNAVLSALKLQDTTPAYTVFVSAACGTAPNAALSCAVSTAPANGASGRIEWTFTGALSSGATGTVLFSVMVQ